MKRSLVAFLVAGIFGLIFLPTAVNAQGFSGSDINNYTCPIFHNLRLEPSGDCTAAGVCNDNGRYVCKYRDVTDNDFIVRDAAPKPPQLRVIEIWFVRIVAILWAFSGIAFTGLLMWIGFKYMTAFNNEYVLGEVIKDFRKWMVGLGLIFLSYPFLTTFFRILPLSNSQCYEDIALPGFQFFFPTVCQSREDYCGEKYTDEDYLDSELDQLIRDCLEYKTD